MCCISSGHRELFLICRKNEVATKGLRVGLLFTKGIHFHKRNHHSCVGQHNDTRLSIKYKYNVINQARAVYNDNIQ